MESGFTIEKDSPLYYLNVIFPDTDGSFNRKRWLRHKSWMRHLPEPRVLFLVTSNMLPIIVWVTLVTTSVGLYYNLGQKRHSGWVVLVSRDYAEPFLLTSFALALLLVFRTNSSYERWWSARKHFGMIYNEVRSFGILTMSWIAPKYPEHASEIMRLVSCLGPASCSYIAEEPSILDDLCTPCLAPKEMAIVRGSEQPPITLIMMISSMLDDISAVGEYQRVFLNKRLLSVQVELGMLERIRSQPIYIPYTRHTSRFLIIYLTFLPFALFAFANWATIPVMPVLAFLMSGIENIGIHIEQPMMVLPIRALAKSSQQTVQIVERTSSHIQSKNLGARKQHSPCVICQEV